MVVTVFMTFKGGLFFLLDILQERKGDFGLHGSKLV